MQLSVSSLASLFPVALSLVSLALAREESPVVSLSDASFESFLKDNNVTLIEFFAPCNHLVIHHAWLDHNCHCNRVRTLQAT